MRTVWSMTVCLLWLSVGSQDYLFWVRANVSLVQEIKTANTAGLPQIVSPTFIRSFLESKQTTSLGQLTDFSCRGVSCRNIVLNTCLCPAPPFSKLHFTIHLAYTECVMIYLCKNLHARDTISTSNSHSKHSLQSSTELLNMPNFRQTIFFPSDEQLPPRQCT